MANLNHKENVIAIVPDGTQSHRLVFLAKSGDHELPIVLRQETYSEDIGWFIQNQIEMTRPQMMMLRSAMGGTSGGSVPAARQNMTPCRDFVPTVIPFARPVERERVGA